VGLFGNRQGERIAELERLISALTARVVKAEATAADCAERAYRFLKKAESRARRELEEPNQEPASGAAPARETPVSTGSLRAWGARGRRLRRLERPAPVLNGESEE
jgi:hypothetical protein